MGILREAEISMRRRASGMSDGREMSGRRETSYEDRTWKAMAINKGMYLQVCLYLHSMAWSHDIQQYRN